MEGLFEREDAGCGLYPAGPVNVKVKAVTAPFIRERDCRRGGRDTAEGMGQMPDTVIGAPGRKGSAVRIDTGNPVRGDKAVCGTH